MYRHTGSLPCRFDRRLGSVHRNPWSVHQPGTPVLWSANSKHFCRPAFCRHKTLRNICCLPCLQWHRRPGSIRRNRRWHRNCTPVQCFVNSKHFCQQMRHKRHPHTRCLPLLDRRTGSVHTSHLCQQFCCTSFCEQQAFVSSITPASHNALLHLLFFFFSS